MNEIKITTELCPEDRARLDRLAAALEALAKLNTADQPKLIIPVLHEGDPGYTPHGITPKTEPDDIQQKLAEQVAKSAKSANSAKPTEAPAETPQEAVGGAEAVTPATPQPEPETPATANPAPQEAPAEPTATRADVQQAVIAKVRAGLKPQVEAIVKEYAERVSGIPEDKLAECLKRLNALGV